MTEKKISFGFSKLKKPALLPGASAAKKPEVQMIQCLEGQTIKIIGQRVEENKPLVIPLIGNTKTSSALAALKSLQHTLDGTEEEAPAGSAAVTAPATAAPKTLEQKAAQEILSSLQDAQALDGDAALSSLVLPLTADELPLDGAREPTMDDYDEIPISHFGLAMLRGMGWKDEEKKVGADGRPCDPTKLDGPVLRPRGMGLGADKMVKAKPLLVQPAKGEVLEIRKGACVRMLSGKQKDLYGTGTADSIVLIDWQCSSVVSPAIDVGNFLLWCTEKPLRDQHFDDLLHLYHSELSRVITACGSDANALFSYEDLLDQLREFGMNAVSGSPLAVSVLIAVPAEMKQISDLSDSLDSNDVNQKTIAPLTSQNEQKYKSRLLDIINDARRFGYLKE